MTIKFSRTELAINALLEYLKCDYCLGTLHNPYSLGGSCEHILCSTCADPDNDNLNKGCPVCSVPVIIGDIRPQQQWQHLVLQLRRLQKLIKSNSEIETVSHNSLKANKKNVGNSGIKRLSSILNDSGLEAGSNQMTERSKSLRKATNDTISNTSLNKPETSDSASKRRRVQRKKSDAKSDSASSSGKASDSPMMKINAKKSIECAALPMDPPKIMPTKKKGIGQSTEKVIQTRASNQPDDLLNEVLNIRSNLRKVKSHTELKEKAPEQEKTFVKPSEVKKQQKSQSTLNLTRAQSTRSKNKPSNSANTSASSNNKSLNESKSTDKKLNKRNQRGESLVHQAAIKGDLARLNELIESGADVNVQDNAGWTPLHEAVNRNFAHCAESLLRAGASVDIYGGPDSDTPLHDAVDNGSVGCVELLMKYGADKTRPNIKGITPEDLAAPWPVLVKALEVQADPEATGYRLTDLSLANELSLSHNISAVNSEAMVLLISGLDRKQRTHVNNVAHVLNGRVEESMTPFVTHLIVNTIVDKAENIETCARTLKYLQAVLRGIWILKYDWLQSCAVLSTRVLEEGFEINGCSTNPNSQSPMRARISLAKGEPRLLKGQSILLYGDFEYPTLPKTDFVSLLQEGGARVYTNLEDVNFKELTPAVNAAEYSPWSVPTLMVVQESKKNSKVFKPNDDIPYSVVSPSWLLDVIASYYLP